MKNRTAALRTIEVFAFAVFFLSLSPGRVKAQDITTGSNVGFPLNGIFVGSEFNNVQTANGNLHVHIPLFQFKGRGPSMFASFEYDGENYYMTERCGTNGYCNGTWHINPGGGWKISTSLSYAVSYSTLTISVCGTNNAIIAATGIKLAEPDGTQHHFVPDAGKVVQPGGVVCFTPITNGVVYADDGSGWMLRVDPNTGTPQNDLFKKDGTEILVGSTVTLTDPNGNQMTGVFNNTSIALTDTLGRLLTIPSLGSSVPACGPTPCEIDYKDSNGGSQKIQFLTTAVSVSSNLGCGGDVTCTQVNRNQNMLTQLTLPNGLQYNFTYSTAANPYGEMLSATLPTGGQIHWAWQLGGDLSSPNTQVTSRTVVANGNNYVWNYAYLIGTNTTTITDPALNDIRYTCTQVGSGGMDYTSTCQNTLVEYFSGTGAGRTLVKTVATDYATSAGPLPIRETTTWAQTNQVTKVETDWDSFNTGQRIISWRNPTNKREYAFGANSPGSLTRTTQVDYLHQSNSSYRNANIADKPTDQIVYEANGVNVHAKTLYSYDTTALGPTSGVVSHDYVHFPATNTLRGNPTQVQRWRNTDGALLTTTNHFNDLGNLTQTTDPGSHNTLFDYTDSWGQFSSCAPTSGTTQAFVTTKTNALTQIATAQYDSCSSLTGSTKDLNSQTTTYVYDLMNRRTQTNFPDGGQIAVSYGNTLPINVVTTTKITPTQNHVITSVLDDLGQVKQTQLTSAPVLPILTDTTRDAFGRVATISNPYQSTSDPTYGITTTHYDSLGRPITVQKPDGSWVTTAYCGSTTHVTDEAGHWRRSTSDALGRVVEVDEPNSLTATVNWNGCPGPPGTEPIWVTSYTYDVANNLTGVTQNSSRQRSFIYDSLSSLLSSSNPESGNITYTYDNEEKIQTKKDARNITVTYSSYDPLHRLLIKTYSNGDPSVSYSYDSSNCGGISPCLNIGHRTGTADSAGSETWMYVYRTPSNTGTQVTDQRTTNGVPKSTAAQNNLDGSLGALTYPSGRTITYSYDNAARPISALDSAFNINYATGGTYAPQSALSALTLGSASGFGGINLSNSYNKRLQPNEVKASSTAGTAFDLNYCFNVWNTSTNTCSATAGGNNGNVSGISNNNDGARTQFFGYDQLNRILAAQTTSTYATNSAKCWGESFVYDAPGGGAWGNLAQINAVSSAYNGCTQEHLNVSIGSGNQITSQGFTYDPSGNLLGDGTNTYAWDAESEIKTANTVNYKYDGDGNRVQKSNGKIYWYGAGKEILAETDALGNITDEYVFFGGKRIAHRVLSGGAIYYYAEDILGTTRVMMTSIGTVCYDADFYPFGGERAPYANTCAQNYKFTGKERDNETGLDYFGARYYGSTMGRWMSPDRPFADQHVVNPQSWNMYSYTRNNPLSFIDTDGQEVVVLTSLALDRIQSTLPKDVRSQVTADKNGVLNRSSIDAIKSNDPNVKLLQQAVDAKKTIEVTTAPSVQGGKPSELVGVPFSYESVADVQAKVKAAGGDPKGITTPNEYDGATQSAEQSPSGNVRVTVADGTGATATEPSADLAATTAHELYGHALPAVTGQAWEHDNGGPVDKKIKKIEEHTKELNETE
jgi:RHS repeat-associated protein